MKKVINNEDLGIPYSNRINRGVVNLAKSALGINKLNLLYDKVYQYKGTEFAHMALEELDISVNVVNDGINNIPQTGAFIVIANHPHGALDGLLLADLVISKRPDAKFLGNFLLEKIEPMKEMVLSVNPFNSKAARNVPAIRKAMMHLKEGGGLIIFPAGEVSTYYKGFNVCEDKIWETPIMKFIQAATVPIVPIHISGKNSMKFHLVGKVHPILRTVRLPLELLNKRGYEVDIAIGAPISVRMQKELSGIDPFRDYLRANVYYMKSAFGGKPEIIEVTSVQEIAQSQHPDVLCTEIAALPPETLILESGDFATYVVEANQVPAVFNEICRLREMTFRQIGEGTNKSIDTDNFDSYYKHLFIWDKVRKNIVGAYRLGFGAEILRDHGIEGFYTFTLFEYSHKFSPILSQSIELGRSFIVPEYQKTLKPLLLLWQGILTVLLKNPDYKYLLGPVSMSSSFSDSAKQVTINYIKQCHWNPELSKLVVPRNGIKGINKSKIDPSLLSDINSIMLIDKLIADLDGADSTLPVLLKKYIQLGGVVLAFNIDPAFNDALDALLLLDIAEVPLRTIEMLSKEYDIEIDYSRFNK